MVSASDALLMTTDSMITGSPILSGELRKQTGPFTATTWDNADFVFHAEGLGQANGGSDIRIGQLSFSTNGNATATIDENNNGTLAAEQSLPVTLTVAANGRASASASLALVAYLVDSTSAFLVGTDATTQSGFVEKQSGGPFSNSSLSGQFFLVGYGTHNGAPFDVGTVSFDGAGNMNGTANSSGPAGLSTSAISPGSGWTYSFSTSASPQGKGTAGPNSIAYVISGSKLLFMKTDQNAKLFVAQH